MRSLQLIQRRISRANLIAAMLLVAACSGDSPSDPGPLPVQYGSLLVTVSGLPASATANVTVTGPGGFSRAVSATTTLTQLSAGTYIVVVSDVTHDGSTYAGSPASQNYEVAAGASVTTPAVNYTIATGSLAVTFSGLPASAPPSIFLSGPEGYQRTVTEASSIAGLKPGTYTIEGRDVTFQNSRYTAAPPSQQVTVAASATPSQANVNYEIASGALLVSVSGLPQGASPSYTVTGPDSYSKSLTEETLLESLKPGLYTVTGANVSAGSIFVPHPPVQQAMVSASTTPAAVSLFYTSAGTALDVRVLGLPANVEAAVSVTGPNGFFRALTASQLISGVEPGTYTVMAAPVNPSCTAYVPTPTSQTVTITAGQASTAAVSYSLTGSALNLCIDGAYITQAIQSYTNSVPLIAGRNALLRVFVRAGATNAAQPSVRVRFFNSNNVLVSTSTITAPTPGAPTIVEEGTLNSSWNLPLNGAQLQPGLRMLVDVDPTNAFAEFNETDNTFPRDGTPAPLDVRVVAPLYLRIVPILQVARGDSGRVTESNKASFLLPMERMFPVATIDADIRAAYTYSGAELQSGGGNWTALLTELNVLRIAEASGRIYYGVVRVGYSSGVAGLGYIGLPTALGWDYQPSGNEVLAHEVGHNFGRLHAPCGGPSGVDFAYPYNNATIGVYGYDITANTLKLPVLRDFMSYCDPPWISDYSYKGILNYRTNNPMAPPSSARVSSGTQPGLLIWGRIDQGRLVLEPAIELDAPATLPARGGPHRVEAFGPSGETLFSLAFAGDRVADAPDPNDETFAFVVPKSQLRGVNLNRLRFTALGRQVEQRGSGGGAVPSAQRTAGGRVRVSWNAAEARIALIRDSNTGRILTIGRGGVVDLRTTSDDLEITLSDGVKSTKSRIRPK